MNTAKADETEDKIYSLVREQQRNRYAYQEQEEKFVKNKKEGKEHERFN